MSNTLRYESLASEAANETTSSGDSWRILLHENQQLREQVRNSQSQIRNIQLQLDVLRAENPDVARAVDQVVREEKIQREERDRQVLMVLQDKDNEIATLRRQVEATRVDAQRVRQEQSTEMEKLRDLLRARETSASTLQREYKTSQQGTEQSQTVKALQENNQLLFNLLEDKDKQVASLQEKYESCQTQIKELQNQLLLNLRETQQLQEDNEALKKLLQSIQNKITTIDQLSAIYDKEPAENRRSPTPQTFRESTDRGIRSPLESSKHTEEGRISPSLSQEPRHRRISFAQQSSAELPADRLSSKGSPQTETLQQVLAEIIDGICNYQQQGKHSTHDMQQYITSLDAFSETLNQISPATNPDLLSSLRRLISSLREKFSSKTSDKYRLSLSPPKYQSSPKETKRKEPFRPQSDADVYNRQPILDVDDDDDDDDDDDARNVESVGARGISITDRFPRSYKTQETRETEFRGKNEKEYLSRTRQPDREQARLRNQLQQKSRECDSLQEQVEELREQLSRLSHYESMQNEFDAVMLKLKTQNSVLQQLEAKLEQLLEEKISFRRQSEQFEERDRKQKQALDQLRGDLDKCKNKNTIEKLQLDNRRLKDMNTKLGDNQKQMTDSSHGLLADNKRLMAKNQTLEKRITEKSKEIHKLLFENERLSSKNEENQNLISDMTRLMQQSEVGEDEKNRTIIDHFDAFDNQSQSDALMSSRHVHTDICCGDDNQSSVDDDGGGDTTSIKRLIARRQKHATFKQLHDSSADYTRHKNRDDIANYWFLQKHIKELKENKSKLELLLRENEEEKKQMRQEINRLHNSYLTKDENTKKTIRELKETVQEKQTTIEILHERLRAQQQQENTKFNQTADRLEQLSDATDNEVTNFQKQLNPRERQTIDKLAVHRDSAVDTTTSHGEQLTTTRLKREVQDWKLKLSLAEQMILDERRRAEEKVCDTQVRHQHVTDGLQQRLQHAHSRIHEFHKFVNILTSRLLHRIHVLRVQIFEKKRDKTTNAINKSYIQKAEHIAMNVLNISSDELRELMSCEAGASETRDIEETRIKHRISHILEQDHEAGGQLLEIIFHLVDAYGKLQSEEQSLRQTDKIQTT